MPDPRVRALRHLLAAYEARQVYGVEHASCGAGLGRCVEALAALHAGKTETVTIALVAGGVLVGEAMVSERWAVMAPLIMRLQERGAEGIRFAAGVTTDDLQWLFDTATDANATISPSRRVIVGKVNTGGQASRSGQTPGAQAAAPLLSAMACSSDDGSELVNPLRESWSALLTPTARPQDAGIATLASRIISATVTNRQSLMPLINLKTYDEYTFVHVSNVAILSSALAEAVGIVGNELQQLTEAALLHDVGKWTIPKRILSKAGALDDAERAIIRQHPVVGAALLAGAPGVADLAIIVAYEHHLRIDGKGYPEVGEVRRPSIPSQIVQVADIFDALRSNRPYRSGMPLEQCLAVMDKEAGFSFDRALYEAFCSRVLGRVAASTVGGEMSAAA